MSHEITEEIDPAVIGDVKRMRNDGRSIAEIAEALDMSARVVVRILEAA